MKEEAMELLRPHLNHLRDGIRRLPHKVRVSWPLNRVPQSREWEFLIIAYLVLVTMLLAIFFSLSDNTPYGL
jgi:hypothetical protein